jgi:hypothetical protein
VLAFRLLRGESRNRATAAETGRQCQADQGTIAANDPEILDSAVQDCGTSIWSDAS